MVAAPLSVAYKYVATMCFFRLLAAVVLMFVMAGLVAHCVLMLLHTAYFFLTLPQADVQTCGLCLVIQR